MIHDVATWASLSELNDNSIVSRFCTYQKKKVCTVIRICKGEVGGSLIQLLVYENFVAFPSSVFCFQKKTMLVQFPYNQLATFDILKSSMIASPEGHKQRK